MTEIKDAGDRSGPEVPEIAQRQVFSAMSLADGVTCKSFDSGAGGSEHFLSVTPRASANLDEQIRDVEQRYAAARAALGLDAETAVFRRIFASDVVNQADAISESAFGMPRSGDSVAVSVVDQPPLTGGKIALLAYHIDGPLKKRRVSNHSVEVEKNGHRHLWTTGLCLQDGDLAASPYAQTRGVFGNLVAALEFAGATLRDNCLRTWIYLKDVDTLYAGMVQARSDVFAEHGMSGDTHFIASTGIEGACADRHDVIAMDAYSNLDVQPRQVSYLNDFEKLCEARNYNVHFERATRVAYSDRAHIFVSGTASIDNTGQVVHRGNVLRQLDRALENVEGLLNAGGAGLSDLLHLIVYLRDPADHGRVARELADRFADLPIVMVQGAVCRPEWLVEVEGIAVCRNNERTLPQF